MEKADEGHKQQTENLMKVQLKHKQALLDNIIAYKQQLVDAKLKKQT